MFDTVPAFSRIYTFTDKEGVVHFSNIPNDHRFRPIGKAWPSGARSSVPEYYFDTHINDAARLYQIDPLLIKAVIKRESNFDRYARSSKGALGLMQLMPATAHDMNVTDSFDPRENIFGGTRYLKWLSQMFSGDLELILASYNAGPEKVKRIRTVPDITETRLYVRAVLNYYNSYKMSL
nr:lytic transglycosylase domain-containing protein [Desulfobulbaceae bacterium]